MAEPPETNGRASGRPYSSDRPYPVPRNMRTIRVLPRTLALVISITWLLLFAFGTAALVRMEERQGTPFDELLQIGRNYWAIMSPSGACLAFLVSEFEAEGPGFPVLDEDKPREAPGPRLVLEGGGLLSFFYRPAVSEVHADFRFNSFLRLVTFESSAQIGEVEVNIDGPQGLPEVHISMRAGSAEQGRIYEHSGLVYLIRTGETSYSLRFPEMLEPMLRRGPLLPQSPFSLARVEADEFEHCRQSLWEHRHKAGEALAELGGYLRLINISEDNSIVTSFTAGIPHAQDTAVIEEHK